MAELVEAQVSRYQEYKPTGVEWMPEVPMGWEVKCLKRVAALINKKVAASDMAQTLSLENIESWTGKLVFPENSQVLESDLQEFQPQDVLFCKLRPYLAKVHLAINSGACVGELLVLRSNEEILPKYLFHRLLSEPFITIVNSSTYGSKMPRANWEFISQMAIAIPPKEEQEAIASFLDDKTAQLDQLITQKQEMLELLREERAALINHAVAKGLDAAAPLRDSGVEWLGEVPAHWEVKKLKWIAEIQGGIALSAGKKLENPVTLPYLRVANVQDGYLDLSEVKTVEVEAEQVARYTLHKGDLLMNEGGDNDKLGRGCVWHGEIEPCLHQNHVFAVRLFNGYNPEWLNLITVTEGARTHFMTRAKQSTNLASISSSNIKELPVLLPPVAEQQEIMALVAEETARVAKATDAINQEIALLQEYRAALIAEAVTGQLDVRDYVPARAAVLM